MKSKSLVSDMYHLLVASLLILMVTTVSEGQTSRQTPEGIRADSLQVKQPNKKDKPSGSARYRGDGWLIYDGELIPGPYNVVVLDSAVFINDLPAKIVPAREAKQKKEMKPEYAAATNITQSVTDSFKVWYGRMGLDSTHSQVLAFMSSQEAVEDVFWEEDLILRVRYRNISPPLSIWFSPPSIAKAAIDEPGKSREERLRENLEWYAQRLRLYLHSGGLIVMENQRHIAISYPESRDLVKKLKRIATTIADIDLREEAVAEAIKNSKYARIIAERFMQK